MHKETIGREQFRKIRRVFEDEKYTTKHKGGQDLLGWNTTNNNSNTSKKPKDGQLSNRGSQGKSTNRRQDDKSPREIQFSTAAPEVHNISTPAPEHYGPDPPRTQL